MSGSVNSNYSNDLVIFLDPQDTVYETTPYGTYVPPRASAGPSEKQLYHQVPADSKSDQWIGRSIRTINHPQFKALFQRINAVNAVACRNAVRVFVLTNTPDAESAVATIMHRFFGDSFQMHGFANGFRTTGTKPQHIWDMYHSKLAGERIASGHVVLIDTQYNEAHETARLGFSALHMDYPNTQRNIDNLGKLLDLVDQALKLPETAAVEFDQLQGNG